MDSWHLIKNFMIAGELQQFNRLIWNKAELLVETFGRAGLGPRYRVIDGDQIRKAIPEIEAYGERRVRPVAERLAGQPLRLMGSSKRSMRIQVYDQKRHGFRWHFDGHSYAAILTLKNTNRGQTHVISEGLSRILRFLLYPLYPVPSVFSIVPYQAIVGEAGDLLFIGGSRVLHRGVTLEREGERILLVYTYDETDRKPNAIRDRIARGLNY